MDRPKRALPRLWRTWRKELSRRRGAASVPQKPRHQAGDTEIPHCTNEEDRCPSYRAVTERSTTWGRTSAPRSPISAPGEHGWPLFIIPLALMKHARSARPPDPARPLEPGCVGDTGAQPTPRHAPKSHITLTPPITPGVNKTRLIWCQ
ncbi:hypothetical protein NDU88_012873 [Pleurodeles waltl]|uniref:Uncharacterized protein n=1 Tax=Pleurodeles waltl TaxID=8319 RepID=A0AAV7R730_PLEWA|nr:hypothetical protein NDU88_012873 [Pleurodeles waltl]